MARNKKVIIDITAKDKTKAGVAKAEKSLSSFASSMGPLIAAGFGVAAIKGATDAFIKQEQAIFQLEQRLKSTSGAAGKTSEELQATARALQQVTVFGDEATLEMQALLLTFTKIKGDQFDEATIAIQNVAAAMGTDLKSAALQVGKALNDPAGQLSALSRSGIQFTDVQKKMIKEMSAVGDTAGAQTIILKELETQFGGASGVHGLGGALKQLSNTFGDTLEIIGGAGGGDGFIALLKQVNLGITDFNNLIDSGSFSGFNDSLIVMAQGFEAIRDAINDIPELPDWMVDFGGDIAREALPFPFNVMAGFAEIQRENLPSSVTFPAPPRPQETADLAGQVPGGGGETGDNNIFGDPMFGIDAWLAKHDEETQIKADKDMERQTSGLERMIEGNELDLEVQREFDQLRLNDAETLSDQLQALRVAEMQGTLTIMGSGLNAIASLTKGKNTALFLAQKGVAVASAVVSAHQASALALANPPGPPFTIPMSKIALGIGLANAAAIAATAVSGLSGGSRGATNTIGAGLGTIDSPVINQPAIKEPTQIPQRQINITVMGNIVDQDKFARELIPSITQALNDGAR